MRSAPRHVPAPPTRRRRHRSSRLYGTGIGRALRGRPSAQVGVRHWVALVLHFRPAFATWPCRFWARRRSRAGTVPANPRVQEDLINTRRCTVTAPPGKRILGSKAGDRAATNRHRLEYHSCSSLAAPAMPRERLARPVGAYPHACEHFVLHTPRSRPSRPYADGVLRASSFWAQSACSETGQGHLHNRRGYQAAQPLMFSDETCTGRARPYPRR